MKNIFYILLFAILLVGCKTEEVFDEGQAYIRVIQLKFNAQENINLVTTHRFFYNGIINVKGDTAVFQADGQLNQNFAITTDFRAQNFPGLASRVNNIDYKTQTSSGVYAWGSNADGLPVITRFDPISQTFIGGSPSFPNGSHRLEVGGVINNISYHKWGRVKAGENIVSFAPTNLTLQGARVLPESYRASHFFDKNKYYTLLFVDAKKSSIDVPRPTVVTIPEWVEEKTFDDSTSYVRFFNFTYATGNDVENVQEESLDIYFFKSVTFLNEDSVISDTLPVVLNLKRYAPTEEQLGYFAIDMRDMLKGIAQLGNRDTIPSFRYNFLFYKSGDSFENERLPFYTINVRYNFDRATGGLTSAPLVGGGGNDPFSNPLRGFFLLARDTQGYQTTITTFLVDVNEGLVSYNLERPSSVDVYLER